MRGFAVYMAAGILVVLAMDFVAPPVGLGLAQGLAVAAWPAIDPGSVAQTVVRSHKSDRLSAPAAVGKLPVPQKGPAMLVGCDPVFSPLSASARANGPGRCLA
jgi:hypothetical protein